MASRQEHGVSDPQAAPARRWESGAAAHGVSDPFAQGPLPWMRGPDQYLADGGRMLPWYVDLEAASVAETQGIEGAGQQVVPGPRSGPPAAFDREATAPGSLRAANDVGLQIKGFTTHGSVVPGGVLDFRITVDAPQDLAVDIYRIGHYGGDGAAHVFGSPTLRGMTQPSAMAVQRTVSCHHWWMTWRLHVPETWSPGAYVAVLTSLQDRYRSHVPFTVRGTAPADLLVVLPTVTWQAYNLFPEDGRTGASLYHAWDERGQLLGEEEAALSVSFDRPYAGSGMPLHVGHAYDFIRFAERYGYELAYADAVDLHAGRVDPARHLALVFPGHDEYWSAPMRAAATAARDQGTSLVFLSANTMYWRVEVSASPSGQADRLVSCRKHHPDGAGRSALWRSVGESEQLLLGVQYQGQVRAPAPLVVRNAEHWLWEGTGLTEGAAVQHLVAGEADRCVRDVPLPEHQERVLLARSPYVDSLGARRRQETSLYRARSGALVFASGTFGWSPALDRPGHADERVQRATANLLDRICKRQ